ncbi:alpha/beta fold hydrolase [Streptococcus dentasini]
MKQSHTFIEEYVLINGCNHYLLHYKSMPENPVFIFIHGGPGEPSSPFAYLVEDYEERNYTIVYYDQRGAGRSRYKGSKTKVSLDLLKADLKELVAYLKQVYQKDKIGLIGHSFGSVLGSLFVLDHPQDILCYIGCAQSINFVEGERLIHAKLRQKIEKSGNLRDRKKLEKIGAYPSLPLDRKQILRVRQLSRKYKPYSRQANDGRDTDALDRPDVNRGPRLDLSDSQSAAVSDDGIVSLLKLFFKSPIIKGLGIKDLWRLATGIFSTASRELTNSLEHIDLYKLGSDYQIPVYYILGNQDWDYSPFESAMTYFERISAPDKKLYLLDAGHAMMSDNPEAYRQTICEIAESLKKSQTPI